MMAWAEPVAALALQSMPTAPPAQHGDPLGGYTGWIVAGFASALLTAVTKLVFDGNARIDRLTDAQLKAFEAQQAAYSAKDDKDRAALREMTGEFREALRELTASHDRRSSERDSTLKASIDALAHAVAQLEQAA